MASICRPTMQLRVLSRKSAAPPPPFNPSQPRNPAHRPVHFFGSSTQHSQASDSGPMPRVATISMWSSMIPKFLRKSSAKTEIQERRGWNPATYFIIIFLLIGSQSIRIIAEQRDLIIYTRKADAKLDLLRKVLESLRRGEDVDVEKMLGTGDEEKEREWEEVIKELESSESIWHTHVRREERKRLKEQKETSNELDASPVSETTEQTDANKPPTSSFY